MANFSLPNQLCEHAYFVKYYLERFAFISILKSELQMRRKEKKHLTLLRQ